MSPKQRAVLRGMAAALLLSLAVLLLAAIAAPAWLMPPAAIASALRWDLLVVACLAGCIAALARHRFFTPEDIDGSGPGAGTDQARRLQALLQNTLEQAVLAIGVHAAWAGVMPSRLQAVVPAAALLFVTGRVMFYRGYASGAGGRAFGFALTFYPSVLMLLMLAVAALA